MSENRVTAQLKAPWHLYVVGIAGLIWSAFGAFDYLMTVTRNEAYLAQFPKEMVDYWNAMPTWIMVVWAVGLAGALLGCVGLLVRRRWAVPGLGLGLLLSIFSLVLGLTDPAAPRMEGMEIMAALILAISFLLLVYAIVQTRRGVLI